MLSVMGAFAEFERALIRERQLEGIALAKRQGKYRGRKKALSPDKAAELRERVAGGEPKARVRYLPRDAISMPQSGVLTYSRPPRRYKRLWIISPKDRLVVA